MSDEQATTKPKRQRIHPLEVILIIVLFVALILFMRSVLTVFGIEYGVDFGEGYLANMSLELVQGNNPYHPVENPPWIVSSYPPLYPLLNGLLMVVAGPSLLTGRFIAVVAFIGILALSIRLLTKLKIELTVAVLIAGILLVFPWGVRWAQVVRVDTLGILLSLGGIYFWVRSDKQVDGIIAAILISLAVLTKHSLLSAPLACILHGIFTRDRRLGTFAVLLVVLTGGSYVLLNYLTGGGFFRHLFDYTANVWFLERFTAGIGLYFKTTWLLQIVAVAAYSIPGSTSGARRIIGWYYLFSTCTLLAYGFEGSDSNYFIEPLLATSLVAGFTIDHMVRTDLWQNPAIKGIPSPKTIAFSLLLAIFILGRFVDTSDYRIHRMTPDRYQNGLELIRLIKGSPGEILSEDASYPFIAGKQVIFQPYIMSLLARTGKWDQSEFIQTIDEKNYAMVILRVDLNDPYNTERGGSKWIMAGYDRWTDEMESAIMENYYIYPGGALDVGIGNLWYVYLPRTENMNLR